MMNVCVNKKTPFSFFRYKFNLIIIKKYKPVQKYTRHPSKFRHHIKTTKTLKHSNGLRAYESLKAAKRRILSRISLNETMLHTQRYDKCESLSQIPTMERFALCEII